MNSTIMCSLNHEYINKKYQSYLRKQKTVLWSLSCKTYSWDPKNKRVKKNSNRIWLENKTLDYFKWQCKACPSRTTYWKYHLLHKVCTKMLNVLSCRNVILRLCYICQIRKQQYWKQHLSPWPTMNLQWFSQHHKYKL